MRRGGGDIRSPVIFSVVFVASLVLHVAPRLAVPARRHEHHVALVVQVPQRVARLAADPVHVPLPFEREQIPLVRGKVVRRAGARLAPFFGVLPMEERKRNVKVGPEARNGRARLREDGVAGVEAERLLGVVGPRARVQIENDVVAAAVPERQPLQPLGDVVHEIGRERVAVEGVDAEDEEAGAGRVVGGVARLPKGGEKFAVRGAGGALRRVHVHGEFAAAASRLEAGLHAALGGFEGASTRAGFGARGPEGARGTGGRIGGARALTPPPHAVSAEVRVRKEGARRDQKQVALLGLHGGSRRRPHAAPRRD